MFIQKQYPAPAQQMSITNILSSFLVLDSPVFAA
jgi:hypothetical protein